MSDTVMNKIEEALEKVELEEQIEGDTSPETALTKPDYESALTITDRFVQDLENFANTGDLQKNRTELMEKASESFLISRFEAMQRANQVKATLFASLLRQVADEKLNPQMTLKAIEVFRDIGKEEWISLLTGQNAGTKGGIQINQQFVTGEGNPAKALPGAGKRRQSREDETGAIITEDKAQFTVLEALDVIADELKRNKNVRDAVEGRVIEAEVMEE